MLRVFVLCTIHLMLFRETRGFFENFRNFENLPKCCENNEYLSVNTSYESLFYECVEDREKELQVLSNSVLSNFLEANSCVDSVVHNRNGSVKTVAKLNIKNSTFENFNNYTAVPKCCPHNYFYDLRYHKCVKFNRTVHEEHFIRDPINKELFIFKAGLGNCQHVIKDYEVSELSENNFDGSYGYFFEELKIIAPYGSYCLDQTTINSYVVRICHEDVNVCKQEKSQKSNIRCIRKCCADGQMFLGRPSCSYNFEKGLNFENDSKVINNEGR